jgi:phage shock protein PspC (stress-responsive transcriptional regulator)
MSLSDEIKRLHDLHQAGALSDAEFEQAKARILTASTVSLDKGGGALSEEMSKLRRSRTDRWLGGVCGGLGVVSGIDSWIWRLAFVLFTLAYGAGALIYLALWIFVPEE